MKDTDDPPIETAAGDGPSRLADDAFYGALTSRTRRRVLAHLLSEQECSVEELVELLCGWEAADTAIVDPETERHFRIDLHHVHLPRLAETGLISYDQGRGQVAIESVAEPVEKLIQQSVRAEDR